MIETAKQYFAEARVAAVADGGRLWGRTLLPPILLIDDRTRKVYASQADGDRKLSEIDGVWRGDLPSNLPVANFAFKWSGVRWTIIANSTVRGELSERLELFMHEAFHWAQPDLGLAIAAPPCAHLDSYQGRLWLRLEGKAATQALLDRGRRLSHLRSAFIFRAYRQSLFPEAHDRERAMELNEGLAQYTGLSLMGLPLQDRINLAARTLGKWPESRPSLTRWYAYDLTPVYGLLLDESDPSWRNKVTSESDVAGMLAAAIGWTAPKDLRQEAAEVGGAYGLSEIDKQEHERDKATRKRVHELVGRLVNGPVLTIPLPNRKPFAFRTDFVTELPPHGTVFSHIELQDDWGSISVTTGQVLLSPDRTKAFVPAPTSAGRMSGEGWMLHLNAGWAVTPSDRKGSFEIRAREGLATRRMRHH